MKPIRQSIVLSASPHAVYEALMDSKAHSAFTRDEAKISRAVGGHFSTFSGYATGVNLELVVDRKIVQTWRASDWPKGAESTVTFSLTGAPNGRTRLTFTQVGVPDGFYNDISEGWQENYWDRLAEYLAQ